jgi:hypothetical protein
MKRTSLVLVLSVLACSGEALDVGEDGAPVLGGGGTGGGTSAQEAAAVAELPDWSTVGACPTTGEAAPQFTGTWVGATEDFEFNPITAVRMTITKATTDGVCGTIAWGSDSPPQLPLTDPAQTGRDFGIGGAANSPTPGVTYRISAGGARDWTLRVRAPVSEPFRALCASQEDLYYFPKMQGYSCVEPYSTISYPTAHPGMGADGDTCTLHTSHGAVVLPLKQCTACTWWPRCKCNADTCEADPNMEFSLDFTLDRTFDGVDVLTASPSGAAQNLRLERAP